MSEATSNKATAVRVLVQLENQLLNAIASEGDEDILEVVNIELHEVQQALQWARNVRE